MTSSADREIVTVQQHIIEQQERLEWATAEFSWLLSGITLATKIIAAHVRRAGLLDVLGDTGDENVQGEVVQKLDVIANDTLKRTLGFRGNVGIVASEEDNDPRVLAEPASGKYVVMFDPLDGSSNIDVNVSVGTIFTVLARHADETDVEHSVLQPGLKQVAAGYVVYGSSTVLVYTCGDGVHMFTLDPAIGAYVLHDEHVQIPGGVRQYAVNEANAGRFPQGYRDFLDQTKQPDEDWSMRYIGSLVADFHRILLRGGVFLYPPTSDKPEGKLRLMYEANPLAFIAEQAGGAASDGSARILEKQPESLHERTPLIIGSQDQVEHIKQFVAAGVAV